MRKLQALAGNLWRLMFPHRAAGQSGSVLSGFAMPHTFGPDLSLGDALIAVAGCLARIFSACVWFALWGGLTALTWSAIENHFWRAVTLALLVVVFLAVMATLMIAISTVGRIIAPRR